MTTLHAIGYTSAGSLVIAIFTFIFFGCVVRTANPKVAPRCTARSPNTVYNPKGKKRKRKGTKATGGFFLSCCRGGADGGDMGKKNDDNTEEQEAENNPEYVQYRGGPMFGWMFWVMSLKYEDMLKGVPGTGTRKNGMEGSMLKVNLDGIVLLRFHGEFD